MEASGGENSENGLDLPEVDRRDVTNDYPALPPPKLKQPNSEFNFQSDFRDRTSSLETVASSAQGVVDSKMIVFYEKEYKHQYDRFLERFTVFASLAFPIDEKELERVL